LLTSKKCAELIFWCYIVYIFMKLFKYRPEKVYQTKPSITNLRKEILKTIKCTFFYHLIADLKFKYLKFKTKLII